jgi:hypothetical protein
MPMFLFGSFGYEAEVTLVETEPAEHGTGPIGRFLSAKQFWDLMERWKVADPLALDLIGFPGKVGKSGKRPRFRFSPHHKRVTTFLAEIDRALQATGRDAGWLGKKNRAAPFAGQTPMSFMISNGIDGLEQTLELLHRDVWRSAVKR